MRRPQIVTTNQVFHLKLDLEWHRLQLLWQIILATALFLAGRCVFCKSGLIRIHWREGLHFYELNFYISLATSTVPSHREIWIDYERCVLGLMVLIRFFLDNTKNIYHNHLHLCLISIYCLYPAGADTGQPWSGVHCPTLQSLPSSSSSVSSSSSSSS